MKNIFFRDGILIYYGNPAGYLSEGKVVLDSIFDKEEIIAFLSEKEKLAVEKGQESMTVCQRVVGWK